MNLSWEEACKRARDFRVRVFRNLELELPQWKKKPSCRAFFESLELPLQFHSFDSAQWRFRFSEEDGVLLVRLESVLQKRIGDTPFVYLGRRASDEPYENQIALPQNVGDNSPRALLRSLERFASKEFRRSWFAGVGRRTLLILLAHDEDFGALVEEAGLEETNLFFDLDDDALTSTVALLEQARNLLVLLQEVMGSGVDMTCVWPEFDTPKPWSNMVEALLSKLSALVVRDTSVCMKLFNTWNKRVRDLRQLQKLYTAFSLITEPVSARVLERGYTALFNMAFANRKGRELAELEEAVGLFMQAAFGPKKKNMIRLILQGAATGEEARGKFRAFLEAAEQADDQYTDDFAESCFLSESKQCLVDGQARRVCPASEYLCDE